MAFRIKRIDLSKEYINSGSAIDIGELHAPLLVSNTTNVTYVDRMSVGKLQRTNHAVVPVELKIVVNSAEILSQFDDKTIDFVIA